MMILGVVLFVANGAAAQTTDAEYLRKLEAFKKTAATQPTTQGAGGGGGADARGGNAAGAIPGVRAGGWVLKADAPDDIKAWFRDFQKLKATTFADLTRSVNDGHTEEPVRDPEMIRISRKDQLRALAAAKADSHFIPWPNPTDFVIGGLSTVRATKLLQVMGENDCLVADDSHAVYWLSKFPTSGLTDGQQVDEMAVRIVGTKRYPTADGASKQVRQLEAVRLEDYLAAWPAGYDGPKPLPGWPGYFPLKAKFKAAAAAAAAAPAPVAPVKPQQ